MSNKEYTARNLYGEDSPMEMSQEEYVVLKQSARHLSMQSRLREIKEINLDGRKMIVNERN